MKKIQSTCNLCALACNLDFYVEDGKIEKVAPSAYNAEKQLALTNQDLLNFRWNNIDTKYDTSIITDVTHSVGMKTISSYLIFLFYKFILKI